MQPEGIVSFRKLIVSFRLLIVTFSSVIMSFRPLIVTFPRLIVSFTFYHKNPYKKKPTSLKKESRPKKSPIKLLFHKLHNFFCCTHAKDLFTVGSSFLLGDVTQLASCRKDGCRAHAELVKSQSK